MKARYAVPILAAVGAASVVWAACAQAPTPVMQAFDHYEAIRVSMADDQFDTVAGHAMALAPLAGQVAGEDAQAAASRVASAETINRARVEFISLSAALVPHFMAAKLDDVHAFMCPFKNGGTGTWVQRSATIRNPYFGSAWIDCGEEIPR
jgi:Cu(I)/Ag(I) efflux system membrane fusion protein